MAEPLNDAELESLRRVAAKLDAGAAMSSLDKAFALVCLPALLARMDRAERGAARLRAGYRALLENVVRVIEEQQSGPDPDPESGRVLRRLRGELEGLRE